MSKGSPLRFVEKEKKISKSKTVKKKRLVKSSKTNKAKELKRVYIIEPEKNCCVISKSDFLTNLIVSHIVAINNYIGYDLEASILGKYIVIDDEAEPIENTKLVVSKVRRKDSRFLEINLDEDYIKIFAYLLLDEPDKKFLRYCDKYFKKLRPELVFYYMYAIVETAFDSDGEFNIIQADLVRETYNYKGEHTYLEKFRTVVNFVKSPSEKTLHKLLLIVDGKDENYRGIVRIIDNIANKSYPSYIESKFKDVLEGVSFQKNLLKILVNMLQADSKEDFILMCLKNIVYI